MTKWFQVRDKIAVFSENMTYTYQDLIDESLKLMPSIVCKNGVIICREREPITQLFYMIYGLVKQRPIYFGDEAAVEALETLDLPPEVFLIATTSGTTGRKKWIFKEANQWLASYEAHGQLFDIKASDRLFVNGSLAYSANLYAVLQILYTGGQVVLNNEKNPKKWVTEIENKNCSIGFLVPSKLRLLARAVGQHWAYEIAWTTAGEALNPSVMKDLYKTCPNMKVHHYYGAAEIGHISGIRHEDLKERPYSVGRAFPGVVIKIEDKLIYAKSPYGQLKGQAFESAYDYGVLDMEGYLRISGRTDTQINRHGRKFDALTVIEQIKALAGVADCLFIQLEEANRTYGLYVVIEDQDESLIREALGDLLTEELPSWQRPKTFKIVTKGIYSETGKYDMVRIRGLFS